MDTSTLIRCSNAIITYFQQVPIVEIKILKYLPIKLDLYNFAYNMQITHSKVCWNCLLIGYKQIKKMWSI